MHTSQNVRQKCDGCETSFVWGYKKFLLTLKHLSMPCAKQKEEVYCRNKGVSVRAFVTLLMPGKNSNNARVPLGSGKK